MENKEIGKMKHELIMAYKTLDWLQVQLNTGSRYNRPNHIDCCERILKAMDSLEKMLELLGIMSKPKSVEETKEDK